MSFQKEGSVLSTLQKFLSSGEISKSYSTVLLYFSVFVAVFLFFTCTYCILTCVNVYYYYLMLTYIYSVQLQNTRKETCDPVGWNISSLFIKLLFINVLHMFFFNQYRNHSYYYVSNYLKFSSKDIIILVHWVKENTKTLLPCKP